MADSADVHFSVWKAPASLERCIEVILRKELKTELLWNFGVSSTQYLQYSIPGSSIPASSKLRQKSVVGKEIANLQIWDLFKTWKF